MANPYFLADNRFDDGTPEASDTAGGYNAIYIRDMRTYTAWRAAAAGWKQLAVNCGSSKSANSLAIMKHNLGTGAALVSVESSVNGTVWINRLPAFVPANDKAIFKTFPAVSAQYWRLVMVPASIPAQVADVMIGMRIEMPCPPDAPFVPAVTKMEADTTRSRTGQLLGTIVRFKPWEMRARWTDLTRTFIDGTYKPFWDNYASEMKPFFFAWDLDTFPDDVRFGTLDPESAYSTPTSRLSSYDSVELHMIGVKE